MKKLWEAISLDMHRTLRNRQFVFFTLLMPVGFYIIYSRMYSSSSRFQGTSWGAYYMVSMASFGAIGVLLNTTGTRVARERMTGWPLYLAATPLTATRYVVAKIFVAQVTALGSIVIVFVTGILFNHVQIAWGDWGVLVAEVWLGAIPFAALGLMLAYLMGQSAINYGVTVVYLAGSFLGGLWTPLKFLTPSLQHFGKLLPAYQEAAMAWGSLAHVSFDWGRPLTLLGYTIVFGGIARWLFVHQQRIGND